MDEFVGVDAGDFTRFCTGVDWLDFVSVAINALRHITLRSMLVGCEGPPPCGGGRLLWIIAIESLGVYCGFDAEEAVAAAATAFHYLDVQGLCPCVGGSEDAEQGVESAGEGGAGGRVGLAFVVDEDDADAVVGFAGVFVGDLNGLGDGVGQRDVFVQVFVELACVLEGGEQLNLAFLRGGVDEVLDGAAFGAFGVECHEGRIVVCHD